MAPGRWPVAVSNKTQDLNTGRGARRREIYADRKQQEYPIRASYGPGGPTSNIHTATRAHSGLGGVKFSRFPRLRRCWVVPENRHFPRGTVSKLCTVWQPYRVRHRKKTRSSQPRLCCGGVGRISRFESQLAETSSATLRKIAV